MPKPVNTCVTCYGAGETFTESGPQPCPDCFGAGEALSHGTKVEWRLRRIETSSAEWDRDAHATVLWLIHELRRSREALVRILTRCQDAEGTDATARDVKYLANEALELYEPK
jgi:hypothetical protein